MKTRPCSASSARGARWTVLLCAMLVLGAAGCSTSNEVDQSATNPAGGEVGSQCAGDDSCGVGARCVLGYCRAGCTNDIECPPGALCVGTAAPFGCLLPQELDCSTEADCAGGLTCGIDGKCRLPCGIDSDCSRNEHVCIAETCVGENEPGAEHTWFACLEGQRFCRAEREVAECHTVLGPGPHVVETCELGQRCIGDEVAFTALCTTCEEQCASECSESCLAAGCCDGSE